MTIKQAIEAVWRSNQQLPRLAGSHAFWAKVIEDNDMNGVLHGYIFVIDLKMSELGMSVFAQIQYRIDLSTSFSETITIDQPGKMGLDEFRRFHKFINTINEISKYANAELQTQLDKAQAS